MHHDALYSTPSAHPNGFTFDDKVARVFSDMIQRSVPGYGLTLQMVELIAQQYAQPDSHLYDLGCSLGAATMALAHGCPYSDCRIIGVDNSEAMVSRCRELLASEPISIICQDIMDNELSRASVVVMNFTLQFIEKEQRLALLMRIRKALMPGGVLVLSEKIAFDNEAENRQQIELHEAFKRANGYSELEISRKRAALENVLIPETLTHHHQRLQQAGFSSSNTWFQCFNFASMIAFT